MNMSTETEGRKNCAGPQSSSTDLSIRQFLLYEFSRQKQRTFNRAEEEKLRHAVERFLRGMLCAGTAGRARVSIESSGAGEQHHFYDRLRGRIEYEPVYSDGVDGFGFITAYPAGRIHAERASAVVADTCKALVPYGFSVQGYAYPEAFRSRKDKSSRARLNK